MPIGNDPLSSLLDFATGLDQQQPAAPQPTQPQNDIGSLLDFATGMDQPAPVQQPQPVGPSPEDMAAMQSQQDRKRWIMENPERVVMFGQREIDTGEFVRGPDGNIVFDPQTKQPQRVIKTRTFTPAERLAAAQAMAAKKRQRGLGGVQGVFGSAIDVGRLLSGIAPNDPDQPPPDPTYFTKGIPFVAGTTDYFVNKYKDQAGQRIADDIKNGTNNATPRDYLLAGERLDDLDPTKPPPSWVETIGRGVRDSAVFGAELALSEMVLPGSGRTVLGAKVAKHLMKAGGKIGGSVGAKIGASLPQVVTREVQRLPLVGSAKIGSSIRNSTSEVIGVSDEYGKPLETYVAKQPEGAVGAAARAIAMQLGEQLGERGGDVAFERIAKGLKLALLRRMGQSKVAEWVAKGMDPDYPFKDFVQNKMKIGSLGTELPEETWTEILQYPAMTPEERNQTKIKKVWDGRFQEAWDQLSQEAVTLAAIPIGGGVLNTGVRVANEAGLSMREQNLRDKIVSASPNIPEAPKGTQWDSDSVIDEVIQANGTAALDFAKADLPSRSALDSTGMLDTLKSKPEWYEQASNAAGRSALWTALRRKLYGRDPRFTQDQDTLRQETSAKYEAALPKDIVQPLQTDVGENGWPVYSWGDSTIEMDSDGWLFRSPTVAQQYNTFEEAYQGMADHYRQKAQQAQNPPPPPPPPPQGGPPPTPGPTGPMPTGPAPSGAPPVGPTPVPPVTPPTAGGPPPAAPPQKITGRKLTTQQQTRGLTPQQFGPVMPPVPYQRFPERQGTPQEYLRPTPAPTTPAQPQPKQKIAGRKLPMTQTETRRMEPEFGENPLAGMRQAFPKRQQPDKPDGKVDYGTPDKPNRVELGKRFGASLGVVRRTYTSIDQARKEASQLVGGEIKPGTTAAKDVDEAVEQGIVRAARAVIRDAKGDDQQAFDGLLDLYKRQPTLGVRTATSAVNQAYSTPAPLAFLVSVIADVRPKMNVMDTAAGNGMLGIAADKGWFIANELNADRADAIDSLYETQSMRGDATELNPSQFGDVDRVIINPPFGVVKLPNGKNKTWKIGNVTTDQIDHAIALKSLEFLAPDGNAILILGSKGWGGGKPKADVDRANAYSNQKKFYDALYNNYNVVDAFSVDGELYKKMGAGFPVDVFVIQGTKASTRPKPYDFLRGGLPTPFYSWGDLRDAKLKRLAVSERQAGGVESGAGDTGRGPQAGRPDTEGDQLRDVPESVGGPTDVDATEPAGRRPKQPQSGPEGVEPGVGRGGSQRNSGDRLGPQREPDAEPGQSVGDGGGDGANRPGRPEVPDERAVGDTGTGGTAGVPGTDVLPGATTGSTGAGLSKPFAEMTAEEKRQYLMEQKRRRESQGSGTPSPPQTPAKAPQESRPPRQDKQPSAPRPASSESQPEARPAAKAAQDARQKLLDNLKRLQDAAQSKLRSGFDPELYAIAVDVAVSAFDAGIKTLAEIKEMIDQSLWPTLKASVIEAWNDIRAAANDPTIQEAKDEDVSESKEKSTEQQPQKPKQDAETEFQVAYQPKSRSGGGGTLVPKSHADALTRALDRIEEEYGDLDEFVASELGMSPDALKKAFMAEQVDVLAMAITRDKEGGAAINADQTGIGKGRTAAAMMVYAARTGRFPIFVTQSPKLMADIYRDLKAIGAHSLDAPYEVAYTGQINNDDAIELYRDKDGNPVFLSPTSDRAIKELRQIVAAVSSGKPAEVGGQGRTAKPKRTVNAIVTTYTQLQQTNKKSPERHALLQQLAPNAFFVFDESHSAGADKEEDSRDDDEGKVSRAEFVRTLASSAGGVYFLSGTYAKNPGVMTAYAKTGMTHGMSDPNQIGAVMVSNGVPMQQTISEMLVEGGMLARRERSYDGIEFKKETVPVSMETADAAAERYRRILNFSMLIEKYLQTAEGGDIRNEVVSGGGSFFGQTQNPGMAQRYSFGSRLWHIVSQYLLSMKADVAADRAIELTKEGKSVIIGVDLTNEAALRDYVEKHNLQIGDEVGLSFRDFLKSYLEKCRTLSYKEDKDDRNSPTIRVRLSDDQIARNADGEAALAAYYETLDEIESLDIDFPASPIDWMRHRLKQAGIDTGEVTGRTLALDYSAGKTPVLVEREDKGKKADIAAITRFNNQTDRPMVVILNRSGATGISAHASQDFKNQNPRRMVIAQAALNIDEFMQLLGRINRTGQVNTPGYELLTSDLPSETRPASFLMSKLASLNANVTASAEGNVSFDVPNFLNVVGDSVVAEMLADDEQLNRSLGSPVQFNEDTGNVSFNPGVVRKVTGLMSIMPSDRQKKFWDDFLQRFKDEVEELNRNGTNPLEAKTLDIRAKTVERTEIAPGDPNALNPFARPAYMTTVLAKSLGKPMKTDEIKQAILDHYQFPEDEYTVVAADGTRRKVAQKQAYDERRIYKAAEEQVDANIEKAKQELDELLRKRLAYIDSIATDENEDKIDDLKKEARNKHRNATYRVDRLMTAPGRTVVVSEVSATQEGAASLSSIGRTMSGVVIGLKRRGNNPPYSRLSSWMVKIAIPSAEKVMSFPLSRFHMDNGALFARIGDLQVQFPTVDTVANRDTFDEFDRPLETEERRYIVTGNVVAGASKVIGKRGKIVFYTDANGELNRGILMPRSFDAASWNATRPVDFATADQVVRFFSEDGRYATTRTDGMLIDSFSGDVRFVIPSTAMRAVRPFINNAALVQSMKPSELTKVGGRWEARIPIGDRRLKKVFQALLDGYGIQAVLDSMRPIATEIVGEAKTEKMSASAGTTERKRGTKEPQQPSGEPDTLFAAAGFAPGRGAVEASQLEPDNPLRKSFAPWAASKPESVAGKDLLGRQEVDLKRKQPAMGPIHAWDMISKAINAVFMFMDTNTTRQSPANYRPAGAVITSKSPNLMSMNAHEVGHHVSHILADAANLDPKKKVPTGQGRRVMSWHEAILGKQAADLLVELTDKNNPGVVVSYASAKTPEEGMAEFIRKYIEQYDLLQTANGKFQPLIDAVENALQAHAPDVLKTIRDASRFMRNYYNADAEYRFKVSQESLSPMSLTVNKVVNWLIGLGTTWVGGGLKMDADEKRAAWGLVAQQLKTRGKGLSGWMKAYRKGVQDVRQWRLSRKNGRPENEAAWEANLNAVQNDVIQALRGDPRKGIRVPIYNLNIFNPLKGRSKQHTLDAAELQKLKDIDFDLTGLEGVAFQSGDFAYINAPSPSKDIFDPLYKAGLHEKFATYAIVRAMLFRHRKYSQEHSGGNPDYWKTAAAAVAGWHPYPGMRDFLQPVDADNLVKEYEKKHPEFLGYFRDLNKFYKQLLLLDLMAGNKTVKDLENMVKAHREVDQNGQVVEQYMHLPRKFDTNAKDYWSPQNTEEIGDVIKQARGSHRNIVDTWKALQRRTRQAISTYAQTMAFNSKLKFRDSLTPRGHGVTNKVALAIRNDLQSEIIRLHPDSKIVATLRDADLNSKEGERLIQGILDEINSVPGNQNIATKDDLNFVDSYGNPYVNVPIRRAGKPESPFHVVVYFDPAQRGKEQYALIRDPALLKVVTKRGQGNRHVAGVRKVIAAFHMPLVRAIVHSFGYMVRNAIRDLGAQQTNTRFDDAELRKMFGAAAPFENWYNWGKFRNDPQFEESQGIRSELTRLLNEPERDNRKGVTGTGYRYVDALKANFEDAWTLGKSWVTSEPQLRAEYDEYDYPAAAFRALTGLLTLPLDAVWTAPIIASQFSEMIEAAPRQGTFIRKKRQGATDIEARQAAMEATGYFAQKPAGPLVRELAASVPFFNPNMQAGYQSVRDAIDADPEVMLNWLSKRLAALFTGALQGSAAIATATLFAGGGDDDEKALYERMEQRSQAMKDRYGWVVLPNGTPMQIAFGEGLDGAMRALGFNYVMVDRKHDRLYDRSMYQTAKTVFDKAVGESPLGVDPGTSLPLVAKWALELGRNKTFYQDRPIEPEYLTKAYPDNPENRYTAGTDPQAFVELSRLIASRTGRVTPSPPQIKHLVTTFAGAESVNLMSHVSNALFGTKDRTRTPFVGQVGFGEYSGYSAEAVQELRRRDAYVDSLRTNYRAIIERGGNGDAVLRKIAEVGAAQDVWNEITDLLQQSRKADPEERKRLEKKAVTLAMEFLQDQDKFRREYIEKERREADADLRRPPRKNEKPENYDKKIKTAADILSNFNPN